MKKIALIIPTLNELENIEKLVSEIKSNIKDVSIFIVDDSNDNILGELINTKKIQAHYFHRKNSSGRGSAIMFGLKKCLEIDGNHTAAKLTKAALKFYSFRPIYKKYSFIC